MSIESTEQVFVCLLCNERDTFEQMEHLSKEYPNALVSAVTKCPDCDPTMERRNNDRTSE